MTRSNLEFKKVAFCLFTFLFLSVSPSFLNKKGTSFQKSPFPEDSTSDEGLGRMLTLLEYEIKWKEKKKKRARTGTFPYKYQIHYTKPQKHLKNIILPEELTDRWK